MCTCRILHSSFGHQCGRFILLLTIIPNVQEKRILSMLINSKSILSSFPASYSHFFLLLWVLSTSVFYFLKKQEKRSTKACFSYHRVFSIAIFSKETHTYVCILDKRQTNKSVGARFCSLTLEIFTWIKNSPLLFCNLFCFPFSLESGIQYGEGW